MTRPAELPRHVDAAHVPGTIDGDAALGYSWSCSCGEYDLGLPSKRRARAALAEHLEAQSDVYVDLSTSEGRGRAAALAAKRARTTLLNRHAAELAELEAAERIRVGLPPTIPGVRP